MPTSSANVTRRLAVLIVGLCAPALSSVVSIDESIEYQTMVGLGIQNNSTIEWQVRSGPFWVTANLDSVHFYDSMIVDLGASLYRHYVTPEFGPAQGVYDIAAYTQEQSCSPKALVHAARFKEAAARLGMPFHFLLSTLGCPCWMKVPDTWETVGCWSGGYFDHAHDTDLANFMVAFLRHARDDYGIEYIAINPPSEPFFVEPYPSVIWRNEQDYVNTLKVIAPIIGQSALAPLIFAEHMASCGWYTCRIWDLGFADDTIARYSLAGATHGYTDGVAADLGSADGWTLLQDRVATYGKQLWMTETEFTNGNASWDSAFYYFGTALYAALKFGKVNLWNYCTVSSPSTSSLVKNGVRTPAYYAVKHFYRFIRPGAIQVESGSDDGRVVALSFVEKAAGRLSIVLMNLDSTQSRDVTVSVSGAIDPAQYFVYQSSAAGFFATPALLTRGASLQLPPRSITSLYPVNPFAETVRMHTAAHNPGQGIARVRILDLRGRFVRMLAGPARAWDCRDERGRRVAEGVYCAVALDNAGSTRSVRRVQVFADARLAVSQPTLTPSP